jgi:D-arabinose 1-dehydrogenase-like Zn-dependent alcohol dehydrogenase
VQRKLVLVGLPENHVYVHPVTVRADVYRSKICRGQFDWRSEGNSREIQEMLDFCAEHNISCMIENIPTD